MVAGKKDKGPPRPPNAFVLCRSIAALCAKIPDGDTNVRWVPTSGDINKLCYDHNRFVARNPDFVTRLRHRLKRDKANSRKTLARGKKTANGNFSSYASLLWKEMPKQDAELLYAYQEECKLEHKRLYPGYKYEPTINKRKRDKDTTERAPKRCKSKKEPSLNRPSIQYGPHSPASPSSPVTPAKRPRKPRVRPAHKTTSASSSVSSSASSSRMTRALSTLALSVAPATPADSRSSSLPTLQRHHTTSYLPHTAHHSYDVSVPLCAGPPNSSHDHRHAGVTSTIPFRSHEGWTSPTLSMVYAPFDVEGNIIPAESAYTQWHAWLNTPSSSISSLGGSPQGPALAPAQLPFSAFTHSDRLTAEPHCAPHARAPEPSYVDYLRLSPPSAIFTHLSPGLSPHAVVPNFSATVAHDVVLPLDYAQGSSTVSAGQDTFGGSAYGLDALSAFGLSTDLGITAAHYDGNALGLGHYSNLQPGVPFFAPETSGFDFDIGTPVPGYDFDMFHDSSLSFVAGPFDFTPTSLDISGLAFGQNMPIATLPA